MFSEAQTERIAQFNELIVKHKSVHIQNHTGSTLSLKNKNGEDFRLDSASTINKKKL